MKRLALAALGVLAPAAAEACAVCGFGVDPRQSSFFWTTVLLSLLPLGLVIGGAGFLIRRLGRRWLAEEFADPDAPRAPVETTPRA